MAHKNKKWTAEQEKRLKHLWNDLSWTAAKIGEDIGFTRNAIIGKARRMGLDNHESGGWGHAPVKKTQRARLRVVVIKKPQEPACIIVLPKSRAGAGKPFLALERQDCRWPIAGGLYCAEPIEEGFPYCAKHCAAAYQRKAQNASK